MICSTCERRCKCVDTRDNLSYGLTGARLAENSPLVKERKYACPGCGRLFFTQEYLATVRKGESRDKRLKHKEL